MNLAYTPLSEAWKVPKQKKEKEPNKYSDHNVQKEMLKKASLPLNQNNPTGNDTLEPNFQTLSNMKEPVNQDAKHIDVTITNPSLLEKLSPFNSSYIEHLVQKGLELVLKETPDNEEKDKKLVEKQDKIEKFTNDEDLNMLVYILIGLIVLDILFKFK